MDKATEYQVRDRAGACCEYCHRPESTSQLKFVIDHAIARQHGGTDQPDNLVLACAFCNRHKGPNIAGVDPFDRALPRLFNPRLDRWPQHFQWDGPSLVGLTPTGRVTIVVLAMNHPEQLALRRALIDDGVFPQA